MSSLRFRPWQSESLILLVAVWLSLTANHGFWRATLGERDWSLPGTWGLAAGLGLALTALHFLLPALMTPRRLVKPVLALLLLIGASASFHIDKFGIYVDPSMIRNVLQTDVAEASELLTADLFVHLAFFLVLPLVVLFKIPVAERSWRKALAWRSLGLIAAIATMGVGIGLNFQELASMMRNHKQVRYLATPENAIYSLTRALNRNSIAAPQDKTVVAPDAKPGDAWVKRTKPLLFVMVLGETARAANWGIHQGPDGQTRNTTPELDQRPMIRFSQVDSCGTNTEVSVPCMFSLTGRHNYDEDRILSSESLLHVLDRAGFRVVWRDNQSGCKGVCSGLETQEPDRAKLPELCAGDRCLDEALLAGMDQLLTDSKGNLVVVMHQLGNHGPAYFKRYPDAFRRFLPTCDTSDLGQCTQEQIINSYDNALLYTDHFLAKTVDYLKTQENRYDTALLYVSDHGESLGERGLFLHGLPYAIAPLEQTRVPMMMWLSEGYQKSFGMPRTCLENAAKMPTSHDHLFHSILGLLDVSTTVYDRKLDFSAVCRG